MNDKLLPSKDVNSMIYKITFFGKIVRWWRRLIGRNKYIVGVDIGKGSDCTVISEYDRKTGMYRVIRSIKRKEGKK